MTRTRCAAWSCLQAMSQSPIARIEANSLLSHDTGYGIDVISKIRSIYREITAAPAGERFYRFHQRRKGRAGRWHVAVYAGTGLLLAILGFLLSLPPLMPGFLLWLPGLALIASKFDRVARTLDHGEYLMRKAYRRIRGQSGET